MLNIIEILLIMKINKCIDTILNQNLIIKDNYSVYQLRKPNLVIR